MATYDSHYNNYYYCTITCAVKQFIKEAGHLSLMHHMHTRRHPIVQQQTETKHTIRASAERTT